MSRLGGKSRWGLSLPGQPRWWKRSGGQRGQRHSLMSEEKGTEGFGLSAVGLTFFFLIFLFLKKKPPSCVIIFMGSAILAKICL